MKKVLVIVGPTAVGKTALSIQLAQKYQGEIISGDSMQIYRQLDIGTAKVTKEEMAGIPHHLIDIRAMTEAYSAADFQQMGREAIETIQQQGKLPIVVGGTGLYIQALLYDFRLGAEEGDPTIRQRYEQEAAAIGKEALWQKLQAVDPLAAAKIPSFCFLADLLHNCPSFFWKIGDDPRQPQSQAGANRRFFVDSPRTDRDRKIS